MNGRKRTIPRRRFLQYLSLSVASIVGAGTLGAHRWTRPLVERGVEFVWSPKRRLMWHFSYLDLDPDGVDAYVRDVDRDIGRLSRLRSWPSYVFTDFLLSTDFFRHGADETRRVKYVALYAPYITICHNTLATFD